MKYFNSLPVEEESTWLEECMQWHNISMHPKVVVKVHKMVASGLNELSEVKHALKPYVNNLAESPHQDERSYKYRYLESYL